MRTSTEIFIGNEKKIAIHIAVENTGKYIVFL